jgi:hypothetical protein
LRWAVQPGLLLVRAGCPTFARAWFCVVSAVVWVVA